MYLSSSWAANARLQLQLAVPSSRRHQIHCQQASSAVSQVYALARLKPEHVDQLTTFAAMGVRRKHAVLTAEVAVAASPAPPSAAAAEVAAPLGLAERPELPVAAPPPSKPARKRKAALVQDTATEGKEAGPAAPAHTTAARSAEPAHAPDEPSIASPPVPAAAQPPAAAKPKAKRARKVPAALAPHDTAAAAVSTQHAAAALAEPTTPQPQPGARPGHEADAAAAVEAISAAADALQAAIDVKPEPQEPLPADKPKPKRQRKAKAATFEQAAQAEVKADPDAPSHTAAAPAKAKRARKKAEPPVPLAVQEAQAALPDVKLHEAEVKLEGADAKPKRSRKQPAKAAGGFVAAAESAQPPAEDGSAPAKKPARRRAAQKAQDSLAQQAAEAAGEAAGDAAGEAAAVPKRRRRKQTEPGFEIPTPDILETAAALTLAPRPVPNFGYACLNMALREQKPPIFTNRDCIKKSFEEKGMAFISGLALENTRNLAGVIQWNHEHGVRFFRMSSNVFPWCTEYDLKTLPDFEAISQNLAFAGKLARAYDQRLTFHPSHFVKLAAGEPKLLARSIKELEVHSEMLDLMGYEAASPQNKINIHIGGVYGDKLGTLDRFAEGFKKLSPRCQARLTVENDDLANSFSIADLMPLHHKIKVPLVFDFHHYKFCKGDQTEKEAFLDAISTWPEGVRPVVHWSESQEGRIAHAHSDYIYGPMELHGLEKDVDVMIEAKCKERALLAFRGDTELPPKFTLTAVEGEEHPALKFA